MTRFAYRFCVVYFTLFCFATQVAGGLFILPNAALPAFGTLWPMRAITTWLAEHVFGQIPPLVYQGNSGDTVFHWVQTGWLLVLAIVVAAAWSAMDRRGNDERIRRWFRLFVRFALAAQMFYYGMAKIIPTQFPPPSLVTLVEPAGSLSLTSMLWTFIGSSTPYQMFTGIAELAAGVLLLAPQTTPLGALIALADMTQVFVLNMTYDVGLKQIAFHLLLLSLFLLAPDLRRLADVLVRGRATGPSTEPPLFVTARANRLALIVQLAFGLYLIAIFTAVSQHYWTAPGGGGAPKSALYGIWDVDQLSIDGQPGPAIANDSDRRWRRVIFDSPDLVVFQRTDDSFAHYRATWDLARQTLVLHKGSSRTWQATLKYERPADDQLVVAGEMDGYQIVLRLRLVGLDTFRLLNSTFRWIRPPDTTN
jgi:uncharacterized membrane protein YphA (DoxX/SURF4 family)